MPNAFQTAAVPSVLVAASSSTGLAPTQLSTGSAAVAWLANPSTVPTVSVHIYGPRLGVFDGRDYDPGHDSVCDRLELDAAPALSWTS